MLQVETERQRENRAIIDTRNATDDLGSHVAIEELATKEERRALAVTTEGVSFSAERDGMISQVKFAKHLLAVTIISTIKDEKLIANLKLDGSAAGLRQQAVW